MALAAASHIKNPLSVHVIVELQHGTLVAQ
jgi:hypothetical protein